VWEIEDKIQSVARCLEIWNTQSIIPQTIAEIGVEMETKEIRNQYGQACHGIQVFHKSFM
jgi:hypothetical protein